jgi:integrase
MARKPQFKVQKSGSSWKVEIPSRLSSDGKRQRAFFDTRDKAKEFAASLRSDYEQNGINASAVKPSLAEEASLAAELLAPFGLSVVQAARMVVEWKTAELASSVVEEALRAFLAHKSGRSESHTRAYGYMADDFEKSFAGRPLSSISDGELLGHVESHSSTPSTFNALARLVGAFWRWCAKPPRSWCDSKAADILEKRETTREEIGVLNAVQCAKLMHTAEEHFPECVPAFAISLFTGMRKSELGRLQPSDISPEGISLPASSTKTKRRRFIQMPEPLRSWLDAYPVGETVLPGNWGKKEKAVRRLAGWKVWSDLIDPPEPPADLPEWPHNALRHTHASVHVALGKPLETLTFEFGHSGGTQILKSHYVGVMPKKEAEGINGIRPRKEGS